jgi:hypothetical protein
MSQTQYQKTLAQELEKLNRQIDYKIVHGIRYRDDSRKHKAILSLMSKHTGKKKTSGMFAKLATFSLF